MTLFTPDITEALRSALPWAGDLFRIVTELGSDLFFMAIIALIFWAVDKRFAVTAALVLIVGAVSNFWLKTLFAHPRPPQSLWLSGVSASNYSLPSGHAQTAAVLWGWLALKLRRRWFAVLAVAIIILVGISRVYLGVHWPGDVLAGWLIGAAIVLVAWRCEPALRTLFEPWSATQKYGALAVAGVLIVLLTELFMQNPYDNLGAVGGLTVGFGLGLALESRYVNFDVRPKNGERWRLVPRILFGFLLIGALLISLPHIIPADSVWLRTLRYALIAIVMTAGWPWLFKKLGL
jgi:membrane-associated phospholipid phosphatase